MENDMCAVLASANFQPIQSIKPVPKIHTKDLNPISQAPTCPEALTNSQMITALQDSTSPPKSHWQTKTNTRCLALFYATDM
jgi:hypothetical protein